MTDAGSMRDGQKPGTLSTAAADANAVQKLGLTTTIQRPAIGPDLCKLGTGLDPHPPSHGHLKGPRNRSLAEHPRESRRSAKCLPTPYHQAIVFTAANLLITSPSCFLLPNTSPPKGQLPHCARGIRSPTPTVSKVSLPLQQCLSAHVRRDVYQQAMQ